MEKEREQVWEMMFTIIETNSDNRYLNESFYNCKKKILSDKFKEVERHEFKELYNALKSAEHNSHYAGYPSVAYLCRRLGFHSDEEGLYEFAYLKDKYGGCYIATMVYGSYDAPEVLLLRKFRDNYLEKTKIGQRLIVFYYKYSPIVVNKLENKLILNKVIKFILDKTILKYLIKKMV